MRWWKLSTRAAIAGAFPTSSPSSPTWRPSPPSSRGSLASRGRVRITSPGSPTDALAVDRHGKEDDRHLIGRPLPPALYQLSRYARAGVSSVYFRKSYPAAFRTLPPASTDLASIRTTASTHGAVPRLTQLDLAGDDDDVVDRVRPMVARREAGRELDHAKDRPVLQRRGP